MTGSVRKQKLVITAGTDIGNTKMFRTDTCLQEHKLVGTPQIQLIFSIILTIYKLIILMICKFIHKCPCHIFTYFITVLTDGRSKGS